MRELNVQATCLMYITKCQMDRVRCGKDTVTIAYVCANNLDRLDLKSI